MLIKYKLNINGVTKTALITRDTLEELIAYYKEHYGMMNLESLEIKPSGNKA
jgi:hypothetical protein